MSKQLKKRREKYCVPHHPSNRAHTTSKEPLGPQHIEDTRNQSAPNSAKWSFATKYLLFNRLSKDKQKNKMLTTPKHRLVHYELLANFVIPVS
jgi:hypothetical protein